MESSFHKRPFYVLAALEAAACLGGVVLARQVGGDILLPAPELAGGAAVVTLLTLTTLLAVGCYDWRRAADLREVAVRLVAGVGLALIGIAVIAYLPWAPSIPPAWALVWLAAVLPAILAIRWLFLRIVDMDRFKARVLVLGAGEHARTLADLEAAARRVPFRIVGFVSGGEPSVRVSAGRVWDAAGDLAARIRAAEIDEVVVALDDRRGQLPTDELIAVRLMGISVTDYQTYCERILGRVDLDALRPSWFVFDAGFRCGRLDCWLKDVFDLTVSVLLLLVFAPVMLATAVAVRLDSPGPALFRQERVGKGGRPFGLLKFRSMRVDAETPGAPQWAQTNDPRVTRVGAFIRKVRIDEMPQLFNVLRRDMSIVGPRPERPEFVDMLQAEISFYRERHAMKPGITGWAQLNYPYGASVTDARRKLEFDLYYVKNFSILFDSLILVQTVGVVLWNEGAR